MRRLVHSSDSRETVKTAEKSVELLSAKSIIQHEAREAAGSVKGSPLTDSVLKLPLFQALLRSVHAIYEGDRHQGLETLQRTLESYLHTVRSGISNVVQSHNSSMREIGDGSMLAVTSREQQGKVFLILNSRDSWSHVETDAIAEWIQKLLDRLPDRLWLMELDLNVVSDVLALKKGDLTMGSKDDGDVHVPISFVDQQVMKSQDAARNRVGVQMSEKFLQTRWADLLVLGLSGKYAGAVREGQCGRSCVETVLKNLAEDRDGMTSRAFEYYNRQIFDRHRGGEAVKEHLPMPALANAYSDRVQIMAPKEFVGLERSHFQEWCSWMHQTLPKRLQLVESAFATERKLRGTEIGEKEGKS